MSEQYNSEISQHYAAYRPPLHQMILNEILAGQHLACGVDIGCGTGISTVALSHYCQNVYGVDPSQDMLDQTKPADGIHYSQGSGEHLPLPDHCADVVTFAGSLSYAKSDALVTELERVCAANATVIVYDFEVLLCEYMSLLGIETAATPSNYDHAINLSDYKTLVERQIITSQLTLDVNAQQLAHILFSSSTRYEQLCQHFGQQGAFASVVEKLGGINALLPIKVDIYYSTYTANSH
ncbi:hypothetical protein ABT56_15935 [Photobacterium aquae]|uniref:Methyltransferase type 11 domain-containing protein n=1 Tax=Photobacterium aquae TaxID=1195763 RepID=A0A0J1GWN1_9GAMM|nr:class I SAM-dependent methyltransferase [Photobacterium aquae]KLV04100.1 hypothetical protein ABT56_15935 [Photobacterium aquae]